MKKKLYFVLLFVFALIFFVSETSFASAIYLPGLPATFYDAEKSPSTADDDDMCWAAASSNMLAWTGWDGGFGSDSDAIFDHFTSHWSNGGSTAEYAWKWWFTGIDGTPPESGAAHPDVPGGGGFYTQGEFDASYHGWIRDAKGEGADFNPAGFPAAGNLMDYIDSGYGTVLNIYGMEGQHGISLWGYEIDDVTSDLLGIYVSDSDDDKGSVAPPDDLEYYALLLGSDIPVPSFPNFHDCWFLQDYLDDVNNDYWWIGAVQALAPPDSGPPDAVPEPTTLVLVGAGLLGLGACRRSRFNK